MSVNVSNAKSRILMLLGAIALAALAAFLVHFYLDDMSRRLRAEFANKGELVEVVVPRADLRLGDVVDIDAFAQRQVPADLVPPDRVAPEDIERAVGQTLKIAVPRGRPLQWGYLSSGAQPSFSDTIQTKMRALTIAVDELNSISGMIRPNDRIDLFYVTDSLAGQVSGKAVIPLLQNIAVKATGNITRREVPPGGGAEVERTYSTLTLDIAPADTGRVLLAQEQGALRAVLKHASDQQNSTYPMTTQADLMGAAGANRTQGDLVAHYVGGQPGVLLPRYLLSSPLPGTQAIGAGMAGNPGERVGPEVLSAGR
ncbi:Flp pilus assembly protein CpaB [Variovorax sp. PAMC 28711]|uniref:Flp pilus assembly protein CpaB n=1 Tax=Variovorax sp. PAMC 28711 TaxID=1795631 RepID=UPI00078E45AB|nr:Flp pilus assembly protein CpaB [Variovorax sp. PAMC 28711]AMM24616.1 hypothetical protein AX767_09835 [Variovorax sp. PAMC 28711]